MASTKKYVVKLTLPSSFLETIPNHIIQDSKSNDKRFNIDEKKQLFKNKETDNCKSISIDKLTIETVNSNNNNLVKKNTVTKDTTLERGKENKFKIKNNTKLSKKWVKKIFFFKTFSGFKVEFFSWEKS